MTQIGRIDVFFKFHDRSHVTLELKISLSTLISTSLFVQVSAINRISSARLVIATDVFVHCSRSNFAPSLVTLVLLLYRK